MILEKSIIEPTLIEFLGDVVMLIWAGLLILTMVAALSIASIALPRMFLRTRYTVDKSNDRGIKKVYERNGMSLVFEPELKWRKYVKQYVLAERYGKKELMCKLDNAITFIDFDVVCFNNQNKVFSVIKVKDLVDGKGVSKVVELPDDTSYVSIVVSRVDGMQYEDHLTAKIKAGKLFRFSWLCSLVLFIEILFVKVCLANIYGGVFKESFVLNGKSTLVTLAIAGILIAINFIVTAIAVKVRERKFLVKVKKNA